MLVCNGICMMNTNNMFTEIAIIIEFFLKNETIEGFLFCVHPNVTIDVVTNGGRVGTKIVKNKPRRLADC
jgi:hypothetical protein